MKTMILAAILLVSGLAHAEKVLNSADSMKVFSSIEMSAKTLDESINGYKKIQLGSTTCYRIPNRAENLTPFTFTCVKN